MAELRPVTDTTRFPPRRDRIRARWVPMYLEPMTGSGERIAIAAIAASGRENHICTLRDFSSFEALYGRESDHLQFIAKLAIARVSERLAREGESAITSQEMDINGVFLGAPSESTGENLQEIAQRGIRLCSSIYETFKEPHTADVMQSPTERCLSFEESVKTIVAARLPGLSDAFDKPFSEVVGTKYPTTINFVGSSLVANFWDVSQKKVPRKTLDAGQAKLWGLLKLRDSWAKGMFQDGIRFSVIVHTGDQAGANANDLLSELRAEAQTDGIEVQGFAAASPVADEIVRAES